MATQDLTLRITVNGSEQAEGAINRIKTRTDSLTKAWGGVGIAIFGVQRAISTMGRVVSSIVEPAKTFESMQAKLEGLYGTAERATIAFENFANVARQSPASLEDVVEGASILRAFGQDAENTILSVSDLAYFMRSSIPEAAEAFGRAMTLGAGGARLLRSKGILQLIEDSQGIDDITKLTLPEFRQALMDTLNDANAGISGMSLKMTDTLDGALSELRDSFRQTMASIGMTFTPILTQTERAIAEIALQFADVAKTIKVSFNEEMFAGFKSSMASLVKDIAPLMQPVLDMLMNLGSTFLKHATNIIPTLSKIWALAGKLVVVLGNALAPVLSALFDVWAQVADIVTIFIDIIDANVPLIEDLADAIGRLLVAALKILDPILRVVVRILEAVANRISEDVLPLVIDLAVSLTESLAMAIEQLLPIFDALVRVLELTVIPVLEGVLYLVGLVAKGFNAIGKALGWTGGSQKREDKWLDQYKWLQPGALQKLNRGGGLGSLFNYGDGGGGGSGGSLSKLDDTERKIEQFWQSVASFEQKYMRRSVWYDIEEIVSDFNEQMNNIEQAKWLSAGEKEDVTRSTLWRYYDGLLSKQIELQQGFYEFQSFMRTPSQQIDDEAVKQSLELDKFINKISFLRDEIIKLAEAGEEFTVGNVEYLQSIIDDRMDIHNKIYEIAKDQKLELAMEQQLAYYDLLLSNIDALALGWERYQEARIYQINAEIAALAKVHGWTEDLLKLQSYRLDAVAKEWADMQEQLWYSQHDAAVNAVEGIVDATLSGFRTMLEEGKSFGDTMADIWRNWVSIAIDEVQKLIARLVVTSILSQVSGGIVGGAGGAIAGGVIPLLSAGNGNPLASTPSYVDPGMLSTNAGLLAEVRELRRDLRSAMSAPVKMSWRRGEMSRAVVEDAQHVKGLS